MEITADTIIDALLTEYPFLEDFLVARSERFQHLKDPVIRASMGRIATLTQVAAMGELDLATLLAELTQEVMRRGAGVSGDGAGTLGAEDRQEILKGIIRDLHAGEEMELLKARFRQLIEDVSASEIASLEQKLIEEGLPETEIRQLCDVHVEIFRESLARQELPGVPGGHPLHTFMKENRAAEGIMDEISARLDALEGTGGAPPAEDREELARLLDRLWLIDRHYARKENQLFPLLEAAGVSGPSQVMWAIHDGVRDSLKAARQRTPSPQAPETIAALRGALTTIRDMIYKEENILFPMSLEKLSTADWAKVRQGEEEIGYAWVEPDSGWEPEVDVSTVTPETVAIGLDTGALSAEQVNLLLKCLPLDITVVDENDRVAYYSRGEERIFARSPGIIGRLVQNCHPPDSVHIVNSIVDAFRQGRRDTAEFWITHRDRFILIRYHALRSPDGAYKGCVEVSQDVTGIRRLEGEQRLLDWE